MGLTVRHILAVLVVCLFVACDPRAGTDAGSGGGATGGGDATGGWSKCDDWSATGTNGATSVSSQAYGNAQIGTGTRSCSSTVGSVRLYCLQQ